MTPEDINHLVSVGDPRLSPDGSRIAYVVSRIDSKANRYRSRVWVIDSDGASAPRPVSSGEESDASPRWSPDGRMLAFTSTRRKDDSGKTRSSIYLLSTEGPGEASLLCEHDESINTPEFSPDGRWLAYTVRVRGDHYDCDDIDRRPPRRIDQPFYTLNGEGMILDRPSHVHVVATDGSCSTRDLTPGRGEYTDPVWAPDAGCLVATYANPSEQGLASDIHVIDLDGAEPLALTNGTGSYELPSVSPDGSTIAMIGYDDVDRFPQNSRIGVLCLTDQTGDGVDWIETDLDRDWKASPAQSAPYWQDNTTVWCSVQDHGGIHVHSVTMNGERTLELGGERWITGWSIIGDMVAFTATTTDRPPELFVRRGDAEIRLGAATDQFISRVEPRSAERFTAPSDGLEVDAWIYKPHDFDPSRRYPMLLNIHGGPFVQYGDCFFDEAQLQARAGFVVVMSNPRGGSGRDSAWGQAIQGRSYDPPGPGWGSVDYADVMAVVDAALDRYSFIDPDRLGVIGGSYGGYMTSWIMGHTDRFAAACSERAANNLASLNMTSDIAGIDRIWFGVSHSEDPEEYARMSPITYVDAMTTPALILHSDDDLRCPPEQADQLYFALRDRGCDAEYYRFPGENHELSRSGSPMHRVKRAELILEFFTRHLEVQG